MNLLCPVCSENTGLHQQSAEVFFREDGADTGVSLKISEKGFQPTPMGENPSPRRDGIRINFCCECGARSSLAIVQHKGQTIVAWEIA